MWALIAAQTLFQHPMLLPLTILWPWLHLLDYNSLTCKTGTRKLTLQGYIGGRNWSILKCLSNNWIYYIYIFIWHLHIFYYLLYNICRYVYVLSNIYKIQWPCIQTQKQTGVTVNLLKYIFSCLLLKYILI